MADAITTAGLVKRFGRTVALDGLDLTVRTGEVHGFLGPNGSGKSTTIRVLLGLLRADAGTARVLGGRPWEDAVALHRRLAYVPGEVALWPNLTGGEVIDLLGSFRGGLDQHRRDDLVQRFQLDPTTRCRAYSKGNRQKVALVAGLASDVELLLLDEPTSGLDPLMSAEFEDVILQAKGAGRTILLSSHILAEAEALCDRISIIRRGRVVESGTLAELRHLTLLTVQVTTADPVPGLAGMPHVHDVEVAGSTTRFTVDPVGLDGVMQLLTPLGVQMLTCTPPTLSEIFLRHYAGDMRPAAEAVPDDDADDGDGRRATRVGAAT